VAARSLIPRLTDIIEAIERIHSVLGDMPLDVFETDWQRVPLENRFPQWKAGTQPNVDGIIVLGGEVGERIPSSRSLPGIFPKHGWSIADRAKTVTPKLCSKNLPVSAVTENALQWRDDHEIRSRMPSTPRN
jgi:hypothetical protein